MKATMAVVQCTIQREHIKLEKTCRQGLHAAESGRGCALSIGVRSCRSRRALRA